MMQEIGRAVTGELVKYFMKFLLGVMMVFWMLTLSLHFCFTSNYFVSNFQNASFATKAGINLVRSFRHNCRIVWGTILPINPAMYPGITKQEILSLPSEKNALYRIKKKDAAFRNRGMKIIAMNALSMEGAVLGIILTTDQIYANSLMSKMKMNYDFDREPASLEDEKDKVK